MKAATKGSSQEVVLTERTAVQFTNELVLLSSGVGGLLPVMAKPFKRKDRRVERLAAAFQAGNLKVDSRALSRRLITRGFDGNTAL